MTFNVYIPIIYTPDSIALLPIWATLPLSRKTPDMSTFQANSPPTWGFSFIYF